MSELRPQPSSPVCFLSYARADAHDPHFDAFVGDFTEELRGLIGAPTHDGLAFRESDSISLGATWEPNVDAALRTCRTFLALISPTYLQRPACNREWASFVWRLQTLGGSPAPDLLLPLICDRPADSRR